MRRPVARALLLALLAVALLPFVLARPLTLPLALAPGLQRGGCEQPEPARGTVFEAAINRHPERPAAEDWGEVLRLEWKQSAQLVHRGRTHSLGRFSPGQSSSHMHAFEGGDAAEADADGKPSFYRAMVSIKCDPNAARDELVSVSTSPQPEFRHTFVFNVHSARACPDRKPCGEEALPIPEGEYVIYKPPLQRQGCPGTYLAAQQCGAGDGLGLSPLGSTGELARWRFSPAAPATGRNLLSQPVALRSVGRAAAFCPAFLGLPAPLLCGAGGAAVSLVDAATAWVVEPGPPAPPGALANRYRIRSQELAAAGCPRSYLCLSLRCDATTWSLCEQEQDGYSTLWHIRPADGATAAAARELRR